MCGIAGTEEFETRQGDGERMGPFIKGKTKVKFSFKQLEGIMIVHYNTGG